MRWTHLVRHMSCPLRHRTKPATAPVQQLPGDLRLLLELRPPVPEAFQRQAVRFAIFSLIQIAPPPRLMMRAPERFKLCPVIRSSISTLMLSSSANFAVEVRSQSALARQVCEEWTLTAPRSHSPCSWDNNPCSCISNSLFRFTVAIVQASDNTEKVGGFRTGTSPNHCKNSLLNSLLAGKLNQRRVSG